ncbi:gamma-aminobutyraldehyde dehydrogenase, partial [Cronobacter sakazakii]
STPAGVLNVLFGRRQTAGDPLSRHENVRMAPLTGSIAPVERIISPTSSPLKSPHLDLGGTAPVLAFADSARRASLV